MDNKSNHTAAKYHFPGTTAYTHVNGNMTSRLNSAQPGNNITAIRYNHLNLPAVIRRTASDSITYVYDATGRMLQHPVRNGYRLYRRHRMGGHSAKSAAYGRRAYYQEGATYTYEYFLKDHLGNNRSGFKPTSSGTAPSTPSFRSDYYPFGLQYQQGIVVSSPENKYLYNGKELQKGTGMLDYGARQYDPLIGRWNVVDPLAEAYEKFSPYIYTVNDPVGKVDPNGMWVTTINGERTEDPDEIAQLLAELKQAEFNDDKKKKARDADKSGGEKESLALGRNSTQGNSDSFGAGIAFNAGLGIFKQGVQLSFGIFGQGPGSVGQAFVSVGVPKSPVFVDASASAHFIIGRSNSNTFDLTGKGRAFGAGYGIFSGTFSQGIDDRGDVTSNIVGFGPSVGIKYSGGGTDTQTFTMPIFLPMLFNVINRKF